MDWNFNGHENRVVHRIKCFHLIHRGSVSKMLSVKRSSNFTIMTPWQEFSLAEINFDLFVSSPTRRFSNEMIYRFHPSLLIEWKLLLFDVWKINFFFLISSSIDPIELYFRSLGNVSGNFWGNNVRNLYRRNLKLGLSYIPCNLV